VGERLKDGMSSSADESRIRDYLAGRLDAAEAERFEQRMFEDDELAAEVGRALEIRAATEVQVGETRPASRPPRRALYAFAVAATAAILAVGIVWLQRPAAPPVFRGVELRMGLEVEIGGGALRARWQPVADASGYELQLLASDGRVLRSLETDGTAATVELGAPNGGPTAAFVEVSALDDVGQTLRRSERVPLPER
jgi:anti-sigma factor RsiW